MTRILMTSAPTRSLVRLLILGRVFNRKSKIENHVRLRCRMRALATTSITTTNGNSAARDAE